MSDQVFEGGLDQGDFRVVAGHLIATERERDPLNPAIGEAVAQTASRFKGDRSAEFYEGYLAGLLLVHHFARTVDLVECHPEFVGEVAGLTAACAHLVDKAVRRE